ncbi:MAG: hypothetical protein K6F95_05895 [Selenomonas sp.]|uniref:hypothetical protein n=1 Tax=Selenomonas sp. TaxID=2053611 RepID=UPI0025DBF928|nr:hypothetical protein [Selenomonas sp.]MCR5757420.1 hypothetical protein [Selenomonas sp.]
MQTNLIKIREQTIHLFDAVPLLPCKGLENTGAVCHPFTNSLFYFHQSQAKWLDISLPRNYAYFRQLVQEQIHSFSLPYIYERIHEAYKLTWFRLCKDYMDSKDFAYYLKHSWLDEEDPNQDPAVSLQEVVGYFREAAEQHLMIPADLAVYRHLPDKLTVYRGVSPHRARLGLSWTADKGTALWFKQRYEGSFQGQLLTAVIDKQDVLAYIDERNERELIVDVFAIESKVQPYG